MSFWLLMITDHPSNYLRGRSSRVGASPADVLAEFRGSALFIPSVLAAQQQQQQRDHVPSIFFSDREALLDRGGLMKW